MRRTMQKMTGRVKAILSIVLFLIVVPSICFGQNIAIQASVINSPVKLAQWFNQEFTYETEMPDYWQSASETIDRKKGDCEDFAILAQSMLKKMGVKSEIAIVKFEGISQEHAICLFKKGNYYSFISNQQLIETGATTIRDAMNEQYPDWESVTFAKANKSLTKTLMKTTNSARLESDFETASFGK